MKGKKARFSQKRKNFILWLGKFWYPLFGKSLKELNGKAVSIKGYRR